MDKIAHFVLFFIFTCLYFSTGYSEKKYRLWIIPISMGVLIEIIQGVMGMGRTFEFMDIAADAAGVLVAYLLIRYWFEPKNIQSV